MIKTINPSSGSLIAEYDFFSQEKVNSIISDTYLSYRTWKELDIRVRISCLEKLGKALSDNKEELARLITNEMGKLFSESLQEIDKSISLCSYLSEVAIDNIDIHQKLDFHNTKVTCSPLGIVFGVMPWNFPVWQVMRYSLPSLLIGNGVLLKHAPNVSGVGLYLENLFERSGFNKNIFRSLIITEDTVHKVISDKRVQAVSFTGSDKVGALIASTAGKFIKKTVLELGGSDPFIILSDANIEEAFDAAFYARMQNMGQSCIAAKRFIVEDSIYIPFIEYIVERIKKLKFGSPFDVSTSIAPLASFKGLKAIESQVNQSIADGAKLIAPLEELKDTKGCYFAPKIITNAESSMPVLNEEVFGPVFTVCSSSPNNIIKIANNTKYGLGASIWTSNEKIAEKFANHINSGMVFINDITKSSPGIPFGGIKKSGYGRELSPLGLYEFANIKSIFSKA